LAQLIDTRDRAVLRRARALALLAYRGYAVSSRTDLPKLIHDDSQDF
jgi:hypothetical protein